MRPLVAVFACVVVAGCVTSSYKPVSDPLPRLKVSFADAAWDGKTVPAGQQCLRQGGRGGTPPIRVENIPRGVNTLIVEFNDLTFSPLSQDGGHGKIAFRHDGGPVAVLPAVPGETKDLPTGASLEAGHRAGGGFGPGYLPPCSAMGDVYAAEVKAVYKSDKPQENKLFAVGNFTLGKF